MPLQVIMPVHSLTYPIPTDYLPREFHRFGGRRGEGGVKNSLPQSQSPIYLHFPTPMDYPLLPSVSKSREGPLALIKHYYFRRI